MTRNFIKRMFTITKKHDEKIDLKADIKSAGRPRREQVSRSAVVRECLDKGL